MLLEAVATPPVLFGAPVVAPKASGRVSFLVMGSLLGPIVGALLAVPTAVLVGVLLEEHAEDRPSLGDRRVEGGSEGPQQG